MTAACWPDFSPTTLALFLRARRLAREELERRKPPLADELSAVTGLPLSEIESAFAGRLKDAGKRASLWAAIGHFPADFNIVFDDRGGQHFSGEARKPDRASGGQPALTEGQRAAASETAREAVYHG